MYHIQKWTGKYFNITNMRHMTQLKDSKYGKKIHTYTKIVLAPRLCLAGITVAKVIAALAITNEELKIMPTNSPPKKGVAGSLAFWAMEELDGKLGASYYLVNHNCPATLRSMKIGIIHEGFFFAENTEAWKWYSKEYPEIPGRDNRARDMMPPESVYFIRSEDGGPVKIGSSTDVHRRMRSIQTSCPHRLKVIAIIPNCGRRKERELHRKFSEDRMSGEWFEWSSDIEAYVNSISPTAGYAKP